MNPHQPSEFHWHLQNQNISSCYTGQIHSAQICNTDSTVQVTFSFFSKYGTCCKIYWYLTYYIASSTTALSLASFSLASTTINLNASAHSTPRTAALAQSSPPLLPSSSTSSITSVFNTPITDQSISSSIYRSCISYLR